MPQQTQTSKPSIIFPVGLFLIISTFAAGMLIGANINRTQATVDTDFSQLSSVEQVYQILKTEYIKDVPPINELSRGMVKGMVEALNDKYSAYLSPDEAKEYFASAGAAFEGIGVQLGFDGEYTTVETPIENSPGQKAGLLPGDVVLQVNGEDVKGKRPEIVATKIRGEAGTVVKLQIYRQKETKVLNFDITRAKIDLKNIDYREIENDIFVIDIDKFTESEDGMVSGVQVFNKNWDDIVSAIAAQNPQGIIIDLRGNPGGYVDSVKYVAEEFLTTGQIVMREFDRREGETLYRDDRLGKFETVPVTILVDSASASASEILAAALKENNRAKIIGTTTVGKGVEQKLLNLNDGSLLILVFRSWLTPNGRQISAESPIQPDEKVEFAKEAGAKYDTQLTKALELLQQ